ncbi:MAG: TfoX/Sxy family protein [Candidatus Brocadiae bacterium]|nr:TfoX/Sxy family protein [Candidatus Brocadiia bacterium]
MTKTDPSFRDFVLDQLAGLGDVTCRAMFGGHGLYCGGVFFAILWAGRLFLKTGDQTRRSYIDAGSGPFRPSDKQTLKTYYEVPVDVLEDADRLAEWANVAMAVARAVS